MRRLIAAAFVAVALVAGSLAWAGWLFATVSQPGRTRAVATAVLDDPTARAELVRDLSTSLSGVASQAVTAAGGGSYQVAPTDPILQGVVSAALQNPTFRSMVADTVVAVENDPTAAGAHPIVVPASVVTEVVQDYVAVVAPGATLQLAPITSSVTIPVSSVPVLARVRAAARSWSLTLALVAAASLTGALLVAVRPRRVIRIAAVWCLAAGSTWLMLPALARWTANRWFTTHAGTVAAASEAAFQGAPAPVLGLVAGGVVGLLATMRLRRRHSKPTLRMGGVAPEGTVA